MIIRTHQQHILHMAESQHSPASLFSLRRFCFSHRFVATRGKELLKSHVNTRGLLALLPWGVGWIPNLSMGLVSPFHACSLFWYRCRHQVDFCHPALGRCEACKNVHVMQHGCHQCNICRVGRPARDVHDLIAALRRVIASFCSYILHVCGRCHAILPFCTYLHCVLNILPQLHTLNTPTCCR